MTEKVNESLSQKAESMASNELVKAINSTMSFRHADHFGSLVTYLTSNLQSSITSREYYYNELQNYRNNYIVNGIYDIISSDVFIDNGAADFLSLKIEKYPEVEAECQKLFEKLNIPNVVTSILPDLLHYGSYNLRPIVKPGKGVIDIVDNIDARNVISITDSKNNPLMFFISNNNQPRRQLDGTSPQVYESGYSTKVSYEYLSISELLNFTIDLSFSKLILPDRLIQQIRSKAPQAYRKLLPSTLKLKTSQSLMWPVIDKLKEVLLLDKLSVYRDIGSILTPNLVGIPVPDAYDPNQLIDIIKKYDELLNSNVVKLNNTQSLEITLQELASVKVVPIVGDRTTPQQIDIGRSTPVSSADALNDSISRLLNSLGIPKELFDGATESKTNLKTNIRYAKKVKRIQKNITRTLVMLCLLHISEKYPNLNVLATDINIQLKNNVNVDELENMESQDLLAASINSTKELISGLEETVAKSNYEIDYDLVVENIIDSFASIGSKYSTIFIKKSEESPLAVTDPAEPEPESSDSLTEKDIPRGDNSVS